MNMAIITRIRPLAMDSEPIEKCSRRRSTSPRTRRKSGRWRRS